MPRAKAFDPDLVLDRAVELFWRRGYEGTSLAQLLEFMGISRQSLYDTYGDKHTLFVRALGRYRDRIHAGLGEIMARHASPLEGIRASFEWVERDVIDHPDHRSCMMANAALELAQRDPEVRAQVTEHLRGVEDAFCDALERARECGELSAERDPRALARFLTNAIHGLGVMSRGGATRPALRDSVDVTLSVL